MTRSVLRLRGRNWKRGPGRAVLGVLDRICLVGLVLATPALRVFTRIGPGRMPASTRYLKRAGVFAIRDHYYQPLFNDQRLMHDLQSPRDLPGVDLDIEGQRRVLAGLDYRDELVSLDWATRSKSTTGFSIHNGTFGPGDADFLYSFVRQQKPRLIVEIGAGSSTRVIQAALSANRSESGAVTRHVCVEPYEVPWLESLDVEVLRAPVESLDMDLFERLNAGDLLFIDSSHMIRPQGDVLFEYLNILPRLPSGVVVHIHDIFTPRDYPSAWIKDKVLFWNEQYLLEAVLSNSHRYQIIAGLNMLVHDCHDLVRSKLPYVEADSEPGSFYFKVR